MDNDPLWYKSAIFYQLHVRSFYDSSGDGIGDFIGLTQKLDYLQNLGVTALWLLPFYPSPLKDDGYDIADFFGVHPDYGTLGDFQSFLREAHRRDLRVVTELVLNHTSDQHPWFQRARRAPAGSPERDYYVWSDTTEKYQQSRIIFQDFETSNWTWDPTAEAYFWHRFFHHQPDLNYDNPLVREEIKSVLEFWLRMGVDGVRLDGVPYLIEREGTTCENLPETHSFLKELRAHVDSRYSDRMFLAEANQWPEDTVPYFGDGDECHTAFHFPLMPRMYLAVQLEDRFPIVDILKQTPVIPENCQWMLFLRNHDELTLEMVTEQERDFMYQYYARNPQARLNLGIRRRLAPLLDDDRRKIELLNCLLFSLPGTPIVYYGDEIGMGDNIYLGDRQGVRTPMQWNADRNAGFSRANPQQLSLPPIIDFQYHYETINVENQVASSHSLLSWMQRLIRLRRELRPLAEGELEFLQPDNPKVLAFVRRNGGECVLIVANLSRFAQYAELDLSGYEGNVPVEVFGRSRFPEIGQLPYLLTLTPYACFWFVLHQGEPEQHSTGEQFPMPVLETRVARDNIFSPPDSDQLELALTDFLKSRAWHRRRAESIDATNLADVISLDLADSTSRLNLLFLTVKYLDDQYADYLLPVRFLEQGDATPTEFTSEHWTIARLQVENDPLVENLVLYDAFAEPGFGQILFNAITSQRDISGRRGALIARRTEAYSRLWGEDAGPFPLEHYHKEHHNSLISFGNRLTLKLFRHLDSGDHPEIEMGRYLTEVVRFPNIAHMAGTVEYHQEERENTAVCVLQEYIEHSGTAWDQALDGLDLFLQNLTVKPEGLELPAEYTFSSIVKLTQLETPAAALELFEDQLQSLELLGRRTAELHQALAQPTDQAEFVAERMLPFHQRSLYQSIRNSWGRSFRTLRSHLSSFPLQERTLAEQLLRYDEPARPLRGRLRDDLDAMRIRCHGNYGLEDVLCKGDDFIIVDFEGDPDLPLSQRRRKSSPLRDVAGMLFSIQRAGGTALINHCRVNRIDEVELERLTRWIDFWTIWNQTAFVRSYLASAPITPRPEGTTQSLLDLYLAERCAINLEHELDKQPFETLLSLQQTLFIIRLFNDQTTE